MVPPVQLLHGTSAAERRGIPEQHKNGGEASRFHPTTPDEKTAVSDSERGIFVLPGKSMVARLHTRVRHTKKPADWHRQGRQTVLSGLDSEGRPQGEAEIRIKSTLS